MIRIKAIIIACCIFLNPLNNIFKDGELDENSVSSILEHTAEDSKNYQTKYYNLDAIISVCYRVNSSQATQFRIWATERLKEFLIKGFILDDERLKNGKYFAKDYFQELLERVRSIRASERRIYLQITDIIAECSIDYDPKSEITKEFYATVQNKFHYAITGQTAAEIIYESADTKKDFIEFNEYKILDNAGKISKAQAEQKAFAEYEIFDKTQKIESDFDKQIKKIDNK